jgi:glutamate 5-kinase
VDAVRLRGAGELGTGGMASKLAAASLASSAGIPVLLAAATDAGLALSDKLEGAGIGTAFAPTGSRLSARKFWLRHAADTTGRIDLDAGAVAAVVGRRRSLLAAGITGFDGEFTAGDVVELAGPDGVPVARGVVNYDATELPLFIGRSSHDVPSEYRREVVHADDLVPMVAR